MDIPAEDGFEIVGPFAGRAVVVLNGYSVPLIEPHENDDGTFSILVDGRLGYTVPAGEAENVLRLVADVIACAWGYMAHPAGEHQPSFDTVPHPLLKPRRYFGIGSVETAEAEPPNDPRFDRFGDE